MNNKCPKAFIVLKIVLLLTESNIDFTHDNGEFIKYEKQAKYAIYYIIFFTFCYSRIICK